MSYCLLWQQADSPWGMQALPSFSFLEAAFLLTFQVSCLLWNFTSLMGSRKFWICWLSGICGCFCCNSGSSVLSSFLHFKQKSQVSLGYGKMFEQNSSFHFNVIFGLTCLAKLAAWNHEPNHSHKRFIHCTVILPLFWSVVHKYIFEVKFSIDSVRGCYCWQLSITNCYLLNLPHVKNFPHINSNCQHYFQVGVMVLPSTDKETHSKEDSIISSGNRGNNRQNHNLTLSLVPKKSLFFFQLQGLCNLRFHCMIVDLLTLGRASGF